MNRNFRTVLISIISILVLLASCNEEFTRLEDGSINEYIYPYLRFEETGDGETCTATVVDGARLHRVRIPEFYGSLRVIEFKGFDNPDDAAAMKELQLESHETVVGSDALRFAEGLGDIKVIVSGDHDDLWGKMPELSKDGFHFLGWFAGGERITAGMPIDPANSMAIPRWEEHMLIHHEKIDAGCRQDGMREYWHCETCGRDYLSAGAEVSSAVEDVDSLRIPAYGHELEYHEARDPGCIETGNIEYWECLRCHEKFTDSEGMNEVFNIDIPAVNHRFADGSSAILKKNGYEPTCEEPGMKSFWYCRLCHRKYGDSSLQVELEDTEIEIPPIGHEYSGEWSSDIEYHWHGCVHEGCPSMADKARHTWSDGKVIVEPGYDDKGRMEYECTVCGYRKYEDIPAIGHRYDIELVVPPSCTEPGYTKLLCSLHSDCGKWIIKDDSWVAPLNHEPTGDMKGKVEIPYKAPTCTESGNNAYWYCDICGRYFTDATCSAETVPDDNVLPALGHEWSTFLEKIDDENHGYRCLRDGCSAVRDISPHEYDCEVVDTRYLKKDADCVDHAVYYRSCVCGDYVKDDSNTFSDDDGPLGEHKLIYVPEKAPTCTEDGNDAYWYCSRCNKVFVLDTETEEKVESSMDAVTIPAEGHLLDYWVKVDESGHQRHCSRCGKLYGSVEGHVPRAGAYEKAPDGSGHYLVCEVCNEAYGEKLEHDFRIVHDDNPKQHFSRCSCCGYVDPDSYEDHVFVVFGERQCCDICGYVLSESQDPGGFGVDEVNYDPEGRIEYVKSGTHYTFTFINENSIHCPDEELDFVWTVNGERVAAGHGSAFSRCELDAIHPESYAVNCLFLHGNGGVGSSSVSITGGNNI